MRKNGLYPRPTARKPPRRASRKTQGAVGARLGVPDAFDARSPVGLPCQCHNDDETTMAMMPRHRCIGTPIAGARRAPGRVPWRSRSRARAADVGSGHGGAVQVDGRERTRRSIPTSRRRATSRSRRSTRRRRPPTERGEGAREQGSRAQEDASSYAPRKKPRRRRRASTPTCAARSASGRGARRSRSRNRDQVVLYTTNPKGERVAMRRRGPPGRSGSGSTTGSARTARSSAQQLSSGDIAGRGRASAGAILLLLEVGLVDLDLRPSPSAY